MKDDDGDGGALVQILADPVWLVDDQLQLARANAAFRKLESRELDESWCGLAPRVLAGRNVTSDVRSVIDGVERFFTVSGMPVPGPGAIFVARDVTDSSRGEREDTMELAVTRIFASDKPLDRIIDDVLEFIGES